MNENDNNIFSNNHNNNINTQSNIRESFSKSIKDKINQLSCIKTQQSKQSILKRNNTKKKMNKRKVSFFGSINSDDDEEYESKNINSTLSDGKSSVVVRYEKIKIINSTEKNNQLISPSKNDNIKDQIINELNTKELNVDNNNNNIDNIESNSNNSKNLKPINIKQIRSSFIRKSVNNENNIISEHPDEYKESISPFSSINRQKHSDIKSRLSKINASIKKKRDTLHKLKLIEFNDNKSKVRQSMPNFFAKAVLNEEDLKQIEESDRKNNFLEEVNKKEDLLEASVVENALEEKNTNVNNIDIENNNNNYNYNNNDNLLKEQDSLNKLNFDDSKTNINNEIADDFVDKASYDSLKKNNCKIKDSKQHILENNDKNSIDITKSSIKLLNDKNIDNSSNKGDISYINTNSVNDINDNDADKNNTLNSFKKFSNNLKSAIDNKNLRDTLNIMIEYTKNQIEKMSLDTIAEDNKTNVFNKKINEININNNELIVKKKSLLKESENITNNYNYIQYNKELIKCLEKLGIIFKLYSNNILFSVYPYYSLILYYDKSKTIYNEDSNIINEILVKSFKFELLMKTKESYFNLIKLSIYKSLESVFNVDIKEYSEKYCNNNKEVLYHLNKNKHFLISQLIKKDIKVFFKYISSLIYFINNCLPLLETISYNNDVNLSFTDISNYNNKMFNSHDKNSSIYIKPVLLEVNLTVNYLNIHILKITFVFNISSIFNSYFEYVVKKQEYSNNIHNYTEEDLEYQNIKNNLNKYIEQFSNSFKECYTENNNFFRDHFFNFYCIIIKIFNNDN